MRFRVVSTGIYLPSFVETAEDLAPRVGRSARWIVRRTGVQERRISEESMDVMGARAAEAALGDGPLPDLIINASLTPIQLIPDSSVFIQKALGTSGIASFSVHATCLSFLVGLQTAGAMLAVGLYKRILVVSAEQGSVSRDFTHPESAVLIGDGAGAAVLESTPEGEDSALLGTLFRTYPEGSHLAELRGCGTGAHPNHPDTVAQDNLFRMNGPGIYKMAFRKVALLVKDLLNEAGLEQSDIALVVPHQASGPALDALQRMGFAPDRVINIVGKIGNCIAASLPMALATAHAEGRLNRGDRILMLGTGAGLTVGGAVLRW
jgi:3-oxoacyl-[acyl-carrier-protein] synthase-3